MSRGSGFLGGAILGGLAGAGLAALLTPRTGPETRRRLAEWRDANRTDPVASSPGEELLQLGAALLQELLERLEQATQAARQARDESRQQLTAEWEASLGRAGGQIVKYDGNG